MGLNRRTALAGLALAGVATTVVVVTVSSRGDGAAAGSKAPAIGTGVATVTRTNVSERRTLNGVLGHSGEYSLFASAGGTLTKVPAVGTVVRRGETAYEVDGKPVSLMYGTRPVWRKLELGMTNGSDVTQLETNLKALGYGGYLTVDRHFSLATYQAVEHWQEDSHLSVNGEIALGRLVYVPGPVRISAQDQKAGTRVQAGGQVLHGTSVEQAVTAQLSPTDLPDVHLGDSVVITLPDDTTKPGKISEIGTTAVTPAQTGQDPAAASTASTAPVTITLQGTVKGLLENSQVQVSITSRQHKNVLAVPTTALRAVPGGTYEVVVRSAAGAKHVPVTTGLFDEATGLAELSGEGLAEGQQVEVPSDSP